MQLQHQTFARGSAVTKVAAAAVNYATTCRTPSPEPRSSKRRSELWLKRAARQCSVSARSQDGPASQQASQPTRQQLGRSSLGASAATLFGRVQCTQFGIHFRIFVIISFLFDFGFSAFLLLCSFFLHFMPAATTFFCFWFLSFLFLLAFLPFRFALKFSSFEFIFDVFAFAVLLLLLLFVLLLFVLLLVLL